MTRIRVAGPMDHSGIHAVHTDAFTEEENMAVADLAVRLLHEKTEPPTLSLVAEVKGGLAGHVAFSPVTAEAWPSWKAYILAPLGVLNEYQNQRLGSKLITEGLDMLRASGVHTVLVYGDPDYYGRFGFDAGAAAHFLLPYELQYPFGWQAMTLHECAEIDVEALVTCVEPLQDPDLW